MRLSALLILLILVASCGSETPSQPPAGDVPAGNGPAAAAAEQAWDRGGMVSAANPYAAEAAAAILRRGGHAVDAALAAHAVLGLVEPQSSGLGGGAFMLVYDADSDRVVAFDGRETAPSGANPEMFLENGEPMQFVTAWQSGLAVGVPGTVALYEASHEEFGRLEMAEVMAPAIELATEGFEVSPRLAEMLERIREFARLDENPGSADYFYPEGVALTAGTLRRNPAYADTLRGFVEHGRDAFYRGELAEEIVAAVHAEPRPGSMTLEDLAGYRVIRRDGLCRPVGEQEICAMPPPSSGLTQIMILGLYDRLVAATRAEDGQMEDAEGSRAARERAFVDAQRLAYADRDHYVADPDYVAVPTEDLVNPDYLDARAGQRFAPDAAPTAGDPGAVLRGEPIIDRWGRDTTEPAPSTTHLSVVDTFGNVVSMTASVEAAFGSSRWAGGFLLNNEMTDFARQPTEGGEPVANTAQPGKRPRSSMSPTLVFDQNGEFLMATGSPGGNSIIAYVAKTLVGVLRWDMSAQAAVDRANVVARGRTVRVESGAESSEDIRALLAELGYPLNDAGRQENSGLHVIVAGEAALEGAADPRREGEVIEVQATH